jgi:lipopolysaccharide/colanic/teichoic acid biosynthesis glycosyltransferase
MRRGHRTRDRAKRAFDIASAAAALVATSPVLAVTAAAVRVRLGKPVLFRHVRPGRDGVPFTMLKFRTMSDARDAAGALLPDADRLTPLGRFLRLSSIDELPELVNVLRGEMSIVGPRPLLVEYLDRYTPEQMRRHDVRPGITGLVQVSGRNALSWDEKFALDVWYVDHRSFLLDLRIIARTVAVVLRPQGVNRPGHATMPNFQGSAARACDGPDGRDAAIRATRSMP